jgi:hypothetical protein
MVDLSTMMKSFTPTRFDETQWELLSAPNRDAFAPKAPGFFARLLPGATGRHERRVMEADRRFDAADTAYKEHLQERNAAVTKFEANENSRREEIDRYNATVIELRRGLEANEHSAIIRYFKLVMDHSLEGEPDAVSAEVGYAPDSRHLVVDLELPELSAVPEETGFRYVKSTDRIDRRRRACCCITASSGTGLSTPCSAAAQRSAQLRAPQRIEQFPRGGDRHSLGGHDRQIIAFGEARRFV